MPSMAGAMAPRGVSRRAPTGIGTCMSRSSKTSGSNSRMDMGRPTLRVPSSTTARGHIRTLWLGEPRGARRVERMTRPFQSSFR